MRSNPPTPVGFLDAVRQLIPRPRLARILRAHGPKRRRKPKVPALDLVLTLIFHLVRGSGTLTENLRLLCGQELAPSTVSGRRQNLPWKVFQTIMEAALGPKALPERDPGAFYAGMRLVAIDGSQFSVTNTPQILSCLGKAASRRLRAAFAKVGVAVLVELGIHNPLAAEIGAEGESEMVLAKRLLDRLPTDGLLIADRHYGVGAFLGTLLGWLGEKSGQFLVRVRGNLKPQLLERLKDGTALVEVKLPEGGKRLVVREIRGRVRRPGGQWVEVRFWTSLLDVRRYKAGELLALYARRWEQELMYRELKVDMRQAPLLQSHTVHTAAQEIAALVLAHALVAQERLAAAGEAGVEVLRISFGKTLVLVRSLWVTLAAGVGILSRKQSEQLTLRVLDHIREAILPARRKRSCPRAVRQPVSSWPRLTENSDSLGETECEILSAYA